VDGGLFDLALAAATLHPELHAAVEQRLAEALAADGEAERLATMGRPGMAADVCAARGDWRRAHELAARDGAATADRRAGASGRFHV
jgi:hypothetical protein